MEKCLIDTQELAGRGEVSLFNVLPIIKAFSS
jgi:hypothetical protein